MCQYCMFFLSVDARSARSAKVNKNAFNVGATNGDGSLLNPSFCTDLRFPITVEVKDKIEYYSTNVGYDFLQCFILFSYWIIKLDKQFFMFFNDYRVSIFNFFFLFIETLDVYDMPGLGVLVFLDIM